MVKAATLTSESERQRRSRDNVQSKCTPYVESCFVLCPFVIIVFTEAMNGVMGGGFTIWERYELRIHN